MQKTRLAPTLGKYLDQQAYDEASKVVKTINDACAASEEESKRQLDHSQGRRPYAAPEPGGRSRAWLGTCRVERGKTRSPTRRLPTRCPNFSPAPIGSAKTPAPTSLRRWVDDAKRFTGAEATIFQRINEAGDMLRVCTSIVKADGTRAVGTYIPAVNADGTPNPVVAHRAPGGDLSRPCHGGQRLAQRRLRTAVGRGASENSSECCSSGVNMTEATRAARESIMKVTMGQDGLHVCHRNQGGFEGTLHNFQQGAARR